MSTSSDSKSFALSYPDLCMFTSNLCITLTRDLTDLAPFAITAPKIAALKALGDAFEVFPSDDVYLAMVIGSTETKNAKLEAVKESIRNMILYIQIKWGPNSWQEKSLGVAGMNNYSDETLLAAARRVHAQMVTFLPSMATTGLTQAMLDDFEDLNEEYEVAKNAQFTAMATRDSKAVERVEKGNAIYSFVTTYCEIGKRVYVKSNPAKYNDYIIYTGGATGLPGKVMHFTFNQNDSKFTWDAQINILNYEIESSTNQTVWTNVYIGSENHFDYAAQEGNLFFRCRAVNETGSGVWSDTYNMSTFVATPHIYNVQYQSDIHKTTILWQETSSHTIIYEVWQSKVPLGLPAGEFTLIGSTPNLGYFIDNPAVNYKYYYYVVATTTGGRSGRSNVVEVEVV